MSSTDDLLRMLLDEREIVRVIRNFCRGVDRSDRGLLSSCFHEDGLDDHGPHFGVLIGAEFAEAVCDRFASMQATSQHFVGVPVIDIDGDSAVAETYFHNLHRVDDETGLRHEWAGGRYVDRLERRDGRWALTYRKVVVEWEQRAEVTSWLEAEYGIPQSACYPNDWIYQATNKLAHPVA